MNKTQTSDLLDDMINELAKARATKQTQMAYISDITEKSNNILLQIEASQKAKASKEDPDSARYRYSKDTLHSLAKAVETFERLINSNTVSQSDSRDFATYIATTKAKIDFLGSAVRKLLALNDTVNQIMSELHNDTDDHDLDSPDSNEENSRD